MFTDVVCVVRLIQHLLATETLAQQRVSDAVIKALRENNAVKKKEQENDKDNKEDDKDSDDMDPITGIEVEKDPDKKSRLILAQALRYLQKARTRDFMQLLNDYHGSFDLNQSIEDELHLETGSIWKLMAAYYYENLPAWRFLLRGYEADANEQGQTSGEQEQGEREQEEQQQQQQQIETPLSYAIRYNRHELVRAFMASESQSKTSREIKQFSEAYEVTQSNCLVFLQYMAQEAEFESCMKCLKQCLIRMIKDKKSFPKDIFHLVYTYEKQRGDKSLWKTCELKLKNVLSIATLTDTPVCLCVVQGVLYVRIRSTTNNTCIEVVLSSSSAAAKGDLALPGRGDTGD